MTGIADFTSVYRALNGRQPFPWQERLASTVARSGWPSKIGIPTGLGKTGCLDVALWGLAAQASLPPAERTAPTRIWYVVNRRLLVDQAFSHGVEIAERLAAGRDCEGRVSSAVESVAAALRRLAAVGLAKSPLQVTRLRGGAELGERPLDPSQPTVVFATVAMFASRWLFRGYGTSRTMRPVDAALAGIDTVVLLDEAHLSRPLVDLARKIEQCDIGEPSRVVPVARSRPVVVALSATGEPSADCFELDALDFENATVRQRLSACKPATLARAKERTIAQRLAASAIELLDSRDRTKSCIVFVNTPRRARDVLSALEPLLLHKRRPADVVLATGRMREREAEAVRRRLLDPERGAPVGRDFSRRSQDLIVVATQTLEVGADLDFDLLVTETCGVRALIQRLGRLNRLGEIDDAAAVIVHGSDVCPVYGEEPKQVWETLSRCLEEDGRIELSPSRISCILGPPQDAPKRVGELLHAHLWEWAKTSHSPAGEAPVELFFEGFDEQSGRLSVCWRAHLPASGVRLVPAVRESETIEIPVWELREALQARGTLQARRLSDDRASLEAVAVAALRPGDVVVLPTSVGLYDQDGWNPAADDDVLDTALLEAGVLPLAKPAVKNLACCHDAPALLSALSDLDEEGLAAEEERRLVRELLRTLRAGPHHPWLSAEDWRAFLDGMSEHVERPVDDVPYLRHRAASRRRVEARSEAFEETSFDAASRRLDVHLQEVCDIAGTICARLGIAPELAKGIATAARLHDVGKADPRFQRWLGAYPEGEALHAKSTTPSHLIEAERRRAGWPRGGRHELLSVHALAQVVALQGSWLPWDADLVLHLIAAHHGHGRPLIPAVDDPEFLPFTVSLDGGPVTVRAGLATTEWSQPRRFRGLCARYGYWGLALMEAIVRQADHLASRAESVA